MLWIWFSYPHVLISFLSSSWRSILTDSSKKQKEASWLTCKRRGHWVLRGKVSTWWERWEWLSVAQQKRDDRQLLLLLFLESVAHPWLCLFRSVQNNKYKQRSLPVCRLNFTLCLSQHVFKELKYNNELKFLREIVILFYLTSCPLNKDIL